MLLFSMLAAPAGAAQPGDLPLDQKAHRALKSGRYEQAARYYETWTDANPNDPVGWYNYACALNRVGQPLRSLRALEFAFRAGYDDTTVVLGDAALASLHGEPGFEAVVEKMAERRRTREAVSGDEHYLRQERIGTYRLVLPEGYDPEGRKRYPLVMLLHGAGDNEEVAASMLRAMGLREAIVVIPQAPYHFVGSVGGYMYWPRRVPGDVRAISYDETNRWHESVIEDVRDKVRVDKRQVYMVGFSQGAAASLAYALHDPAHIAGAVIMAGFLPGDYPHADMLAELGRYDVKMLILHGEYDPQIGVDHASGLAAALQRAGVDATFKRYPLEHVVSEEMAHDAANWLRLQMGIAVSNDCAGL